MNISRQQRRALGTGIGVIVASVVLTATGNKTVLQPGDLLISDFSSASGANDGTSIRACAGWRGACR